MYYKLLKGYLGFGFVMQLAVKWLGSFTTYDSIILAVRTSNVELAGRG